MSPLTPLPQPKSPIFSSRVPGTAGWTSRVFPESQCSHRPSHVFTVNTRNASKTDLLLDSTSDLNWNQAINQALLALQINKRVNIEPILSGVAAMV